MAEPSVLRGDYHFQGTVSATAIDIPASTIVNADVSATAAIAASKQEHNHRKTYGETGSAVTYTRICHIVMGTTGTLRYFKVSQLTAPTGSATVTLDLKINNTSALSSVVTINSSKSAREVTSATINTTALASGDVLEVVQTVTTPGTDTTATGVAWDLDLNEDYPA